MQTLLHYKITWLKSDKSTLWKLWRGHNEYYKYYNIQSVLLWQMETLFWGQQTVTLTRKGLVHYFFTQHYFNDNIL